MDSDGGSWGYKNVLWGQKISARKSWKNSKYVLESSSKDLSKAHLDFLLNRHVTQFFAPWKNFDRCDKKVPECCSWCVFRSIGAHFFFAAQWKHLFQCQRIDCERNRILIHRDWQRLRKANRYWVQSAKHPTGKWSKTVQLTDVWQKMIKYTCLWKQNIFFDIKESLMTLVSFWFIVVDKCWEKNKLFMVQNAVQGTGKWWKTVSLTLVW